MSIRECPSKVLALYLSVEDPAISLDDRLVPLQHNLAVRPIRSERYKAGEASFAPDCVTLGGTVKHLCFEFDPNKLGENLSLSLWALLGEVNPPLPRQYQRSDFTSQ